MHQLGHENLAEDRDPAQPEGHHRDGFAGETTCRLRAVGRQRSGEFRHESGVERTLAEQAANKFGSLLATKNASATGPAPIRAAMSMSRIKPRTRLAMVQPPTVMTLLGVRRRPAVDGQSRCLPAMAGDRAGHDGQTFMPDPREARPHGSRPDGSHHGQAQQPRVPRFISCQCRVAVHVTGKVVASPAT